MEQKTILLACPHGIHSVNFIKEILLPIRDITNSKIMVFFHSSNYIQENFRDEIEGFKKEGVIILTRSSEKQCRVKLGRRIYDILGEIRLLKNIRNIDVCIFSRLTRRQCLMAFLLKRRVKKKVVLFWGSDLLRASRQTRMLQKMTLKNMDFAVVLTEKMGEAYVNNFGSMSSPKLEIIKYVGNDFRKILEVRDKEGKDEARAKLNLPQNRILLSCGYRPNPDMKHIDIINEVMKCPKEIRDKVCLVFPLTYGGTEEYIKEIHDKCNESGLLTQKFTQFMSNEDIARLRVATDVFIMIAPTDAFSLSMQEHLVARNIVIKGKWLDYNELRNTSLSVVELEKVEKLHEVISDIVSRYEDMANSVISYPEKILLEISSSKEILEKWKKIILEAQ